MRSLLVLVAVLAAGLACEDSSRRAARESSQPRPVDAVAGAAPIDLVIVLDLSKSMEETDLPPDRLVAVTRALQRFVSQNVRDRIALVIFGEQAKLVAPLTTSTADLEAHLFGVSIGDVPALGTAMGDGLALAVDQLGTSTAHARAIILFTDGDNNVVVRSTPEQARDLAVAARIPVHTIAIGSAAPNDHGGIPMNPDVPLDIAAATGGTFHTAADPAALDRALDDIRARLDQLARQP